MPGARLSNAQLVNKLKELLKIKYGKLHFLGEIIKTCGKQLEKKINEEIKILINTNKDKPIREILIQEERGWREANEEFASLRSVVEPYSLRIAMEWKLGEYSKKEDN